MYIFWLIVWNRVTNSPLFVWNKSRASKIQQYTPAVNLTELGPHECRGNLGLSSNYLTINDHDALIKVVMFHG